MPKDIISETEIRVDHAIIEKNFKQSPPILAQQIPSPLDCDIFRPWYSVLAEYALLIQTNRLRAIHGCFTIMMIRPPD